MKVPTLFSSIVCHFLCLLKAFATRHTSRCYSRSSTVYRPEPNGFAEGTIPNLGNYGRLGFKRKYISNFRCVNSPILRCQCLHLLYTDRHYEMRQLRIFQKMVANGLIYRQHRPVYYSPSSRSALAEAELEYNDRTSESAYIQFDLDTNSKPLHPDLAEVLSKGIDIKFLVWTTTPWTLTANMGIAVHEDLLYDLLLDGKVAYVISSDRVEATSKILDVGRIVRLASLPGEHDPTLSCLYLKRCRQVRTWLVFNTNHCSKGPNFLILTKSFTPPTLCQMLELALFILRLHTEQKITTRSVTSPQILDQIYFVTSMAMVCSALMSPTLLEKKVQWHLLGEMFYILELK